MIMSRTYPLYYQSLFPDEIDQFDRFTDLTLDTITYANQYNTYMLKGDFTNAAKVLIEHPELKPSLINAENLNRIIDAIKCIETFYVEDVQKYLIEIIKFRSEYNANTKYSKYDLITYNNIGYLCISSTTPLGTPPTDKNYFTALTLQGERGESGWGLAFCGQWIPTKAYNIYDCIAYNNCLYASTCDDNVGHTPSQTSSYWTLVFDITEFTIYNNSSSGLSATNIQDAIDELNIHTINNANNISTNANNISNINNRISNVDNVRDADKIVKHSNTSDYATSASNSDAVDGFHFQISTADLEAGNSYLSTNVFYFVYEQG